MFSCDDGKAIGHFDVGDTVIGVCVDQHGLVYTSHADDKVRAWTGERDDRTMARTIGFGWLSRACGLFVHAGLLYVGSYRSKPPVRSSVLYDCSPVRVFEGSGGYRWSIGDVLKSPLGVVVVDCEQR